MSCLSYLHHFFNRFYQVIKLQQSVYRKTEVHMLKGVDSEENSSTVDKE